MQLDTISSTIYWRPGLAGSNNFGEYTTYSSYTLNELSLFYLMYIRSNILELDGKISEKQILLFTNCNTLPVLLCIMCYVAFGNKHHSNLFIALLLLSCYIV